MKIVRVLQSGRSTKDKVFEAVEERLGFLLHFFELFGGQDFLDVLLESRAISPRFQRTIVVGLNGLDRDILISSQRSHNSGLVRQRYLISRVGREQPLQGGSGTIEHGSTLSTDFDSDVELLEVSKVGGDTTNVVGG